jgi:hypothetical protein
VPEDALGDAGELVQGVAAEAHEGFYFAGAVLEVRGEGLVAGLEAGLGLWHFFCGDLFNNKYGRESAWACPV